VPLKYFRNFYMRTKKQLLAFYFSVA
jgi:hypothetical protein